MEKTLEFRGLQQKTIISYLLSLSNLSHKDIITNNDGSVTIKMPNWQATISAEENYSFGESISFPRLFITFVGEEKRLDELIAKLRTKTIRLGG